VRGLSRFKLLKREEGFRARTYLTKPPSKIFVLTSKRKARSSVVKKRWADGWSSQNSGTERAGGEIKTELGDLKATEETQKSLYITKPKKKGGSLEAFSKQKDFC